MSVTPNLVEFFRGLSKVPSVSFFEYLAYEFIIGHFSRLCKKLDAETVGKLQLGFTSANQLCVRWTGSPKESRRLVVVAHVDKEGFFINKFSGDRSSCTGKHVRGDPIEEDRLGQSVRVITRDCTYRGRLVSEDPSDLTIKLSIGEELGPGLPSLRHAVGIEAVAEYDLPEFSLDKSGLISSPCVDNSAGVSVLVNLVEGCAVGLWPVNVDAVFTTCEEPGFCGISRQILSGGPLLETSDSSWLVVDSSNRSRCHIFRMPQALRSDLELADAELDPTGVDLRVTVNRVGDRFVCYSRSMAGLIHMASLNAQRKSYLNFRYPNECDLQDEFVFTQAQREWYSEDSVEILSARMIGGWCEAGPLRLSAFLRRAMGVAEVVPPRVGAIGIPIGNYRNTFEGRIAREKCHVASLLRACSLIAEIAKLHQRYDFGQTVESSPKSEEQPEARTGDLVAWLKSAEPFMGATDSWVEELKKAVGYTDSDGFFVDRGFESACEVLGRLRS